MTLNTWQYYCKSNKKIFENLEKIAARDYQSKAAESMLNSALKVFEALDRAVPQYLANQPSITKISMKTVHCGITSDELRPLFHLLSRVGLNLEAKDIWKEIKEFSISIDPGGLQISEKSILYS